MARVELASLSLGWVTDTAGNAQAGVTPTITNSAGNPATVYSASTGSGTRSAVSDSTGYMQGFLEEGTYTFTISGVAHSVDVVSGSPGGVRFATSYGAKATADDTTGIQAAVDAASTDGGPVDLPGSYSLAGELTLKDKVHLRGSGMGATTLTWSDLGTGRYAVKPQTSPAGGASAPSITGMSLIGPGAPSLGVRTSNMDGIQAAGNVNLTDVVLGRFGSNLVLIGDHNTFTRLKSTDGYYNVLYADGWTTKGNQAFYSCKLDHPTFAAIAVAGSNNLDGVDLINCDLGGGPYGLYKFDGAAPSTIGLMTESTLLNTSFESVGNAAILDESTGGGSGLDTITYSTIDNPGFTWEPTHKIPARNKDYAVKARNVTDLRYRPGTYPFTAGDVGVFSTSVTQGYKTTLPYSASITPDTSLTPAYEIVVTNGSAFTINNPTNGGIQSPVTFSIVNSSGGAMGAITWGGLYLLAGAFTNPANGKRRTLTLYWEGGGYVELCRSAADI